MKKSLVRLFICVLAFAFYANAQPNQQKDFAQASYTLGYELIATGRAEDALPFL